MVVRDDVPPDAARRPWPRSSPGSRREREARDDARAGPPGPNLNLLGTREPAIYGRETLEEIHAGIAARAVELGLDVTFYQSNHEGDLIDRLQVRDFDASIVNAAGYTHTSVALRDALLAIERPFWEVHLSDPWQRDAFRRVNLLHDIATNRSSARAPAGTWRSRRSRSGSEVGRDPAGRRDEHGERVQYGGTGGGEGAEGGGRGGG